MEQTACQRIVDRDSRVIAPCQHLSYFPLAVAEYHGDLLTDADGREYIDFLSSASSMNLGGSPAPVKAALLAQMDRCIQYTGAYTYSEPMVAYAERLAAAYPGGVPVKVAFGNCGSDANDCAVKFARAWTGRENILVFSSGYHGSTYGSGSMSDCCAALYAKMGPLLPGIHTFPFFGSDVDDATCERECLRQIEAAFASHLPPDTVAAAVIEPVQGDSGILPAHPIFLKKLYDLCRAHGILFLCEEVQQGFWRTGTLFSIERYGLVPDGIILGKSAGGGLPLGAFVGRAEMMDCLPAPAHLFTLGGHAMACAAGAAAFDYYQTEAFQTRLAENIRLLTGEAAALRQRFPSLVSFVRQAGMSMGIGIGRPGADGVPVPDPDATFRILYRAYEKGLLVISLAGHILRIQPPLNIDPALLRRGFAILGEAMADELSGAIPDDVLVHRAGW